MKTGNFWLLGFSTIVLLANSGCGAKKGDNPESSVALAWGATPTVDSTCKITIPATAAFSAYISKPKNPLNPLSKDEKNTGKFSSATGKLEIDVAGVTFSSVCATDGVTSNSSGLTCTLNTFPNLLNEPPTDWYTRRAIHSTWTVTGSNPATETVLKRDLNIIFEPVALVAPAPSNPPTLANLIVSGVQPKCVSTGCNPGIRGALAIGDNHTCALMPDKTVSCWGANNHGQLGNSTVVDSQSPVAVQNLTDVVSISAGNSHTCALTSTGNVKCWGYGASGQITLATLAGSLTPVNIDGIESAVALISGKYHNCVITSNAAMKCWGLNSDGQLGDGTTTSTATPVDVAGVSGVVAASTGYHHTCAVISDGSVKCWGNNFWGQIGDGTADGGSTQNTVKLTPTAVTGVADAVAVSVGYGHSCIITTAGKASCWGLGNSFQLGTTITAQACPTEVGQTPTTNCSLAPIEIPNLSGVVAINASSDTTCVHTNDSKVRCFGYMADGNMSINFGGTGVVLMDDALLFAAGNAHACAINRSGELRCQGANNNGQLGDGTTKNSTNYENKFMPVTVKQDASTQLKPAYVHCRTYKLGIN